MLRILIAFSYYTKSYLLCLCCLADFTIIALRSGEGQPGREDQCVLGVGALVVSLRMEQGKGAGKQIDRN